MINSLSELIGQSIERCGSKTALIQHLPNGTSASYSFKALKQMAGKISSLMGGSLSGDECIGLYMQRSAEHVAAIVASLHSISPYTTINHLVSSRQISHIVRDSNLKLLICDNSTVLKLRALTQSDESKAILASIRIVHIHNSDQLPPVYQQTIALLSEFTTVQSVTLAETQSSDLQVVKAEAASKARLILFTSGSTGNPKGVMIKGDDLINRIQSESKAYGLKEGDVLLNILPFSFDVGCNQLYSALTNGCTLVLLNSWMPKDIVSAIVNYKVNGVSGVPSLWLSVVNSSLQELKNVAYMLRYITISGGDMAEKDLVALREALPGVNIFKTYGQTETFRSGMLLAEHFDDKHQSVGQPVDGVKLLILDEDGNEVMPGKVGEIVHQGTGTMLGYIGDEKTTNGKLKVLPEHLSKVKDKVIYTGDLGSMDEDGFLYLHGRKDRMFKVRGNRVYPEEIEKELCTHSDVIEAASSYSAPQECITVFVRTKQETSLTEKDVMKFLSARLPSYMVPNKCLIYEDFPRTASGKVDVPMLALQV